MSSRTQIRIGKARLTVTGLSPQAVARSSETRVPGAPTFAGMDYQKTGTGEMVTTIEAQTVPVLVDGTDAIGVLMQHHLAQDSVSYIRMGGNFQAQYMGSVIVRVLDTDEESLHPFTGVGRRVNCSMELLHVG
ncbi:MAG: hypothetical protein AAF141_02745 [Pseudomonadota bacterium]